MIPDNIKNPPTLSVTPSEVKQLEDVLNSVSPVSSSNDDLSITLTQKQWKLLRTVVSSFLWLLSLLPVRKAGIEIIRKVFNISLSPLVKEHSKKENNDNTSTPVTPPIATNECEDCDSNSNENSNGKSNSSDETIPGPKSRPNHHGRRKSDDFKDVPKVDFFPELKSGDQCLGPDCRGKVYPFLVEGEVRKVLRFVFSPPFQPTIYQMHDLRCNICFRVYKAKIPIELIEDGALDERYLYSAQIALVIFHYGFGLPMHRLDLLQSLIGERFPESTQFDICEKVANIFKCMVDAIEREAANSFLFQGDDVGNRVRDLNAILRERRSDNKIVYREGVHTSLLIATTNEGHLLPVSKTGIIHFGELLDQVLSKRSANLPPVNLVCDANKVNKTFVGDIITGGCWQHARDYFVKAKNNFPKEAIVFIDLFKNIFKIDRETHQMNAVERLEYLKKNAQPIAKEIKKLVDDSVTKKIALPKSELGEAFTYFQNQYDKLSLPFEIAGMPIHNNISEWCTYLFVRLLVNSKFYNTAAGAAIGDTIITMILFSYLSLVNPYDYMLYCYKHKEEMKKNPHDFFPWKLGEKIESMPKNKQMKFWAPSPPIDQDLFDKPKVCT
ncbi:MAG: transposase [Oligoflexia bacterium]|nr:transposase [Oligoflexia bacterium]